MRTGTFAAWITVAMLFLISNQSFAVPAPMRVKPGQLTTLLRYGALTGGQSAQELSLIGVRSVAQNDGERFEFQYGDREGRPWKGQLGYYHVTLDRDGRRVIIDLAQVNRTAVEPKHLQKILGASKLVANSDMTMDPHDGSTNITLYLKVPSQLAIEGDAGKRGQIAFRLIPSEGSSR